MHHYASTSYWTSFCRTVFGHREPQSDPLIPFHQDHKLHMLRSLWGAAQMGHFWGPQSPYIWVHFWRNVRRIGSYILSSSLLLGSKQRISSDFGNQRYIIGVIDTGCICGVMRLPPEDYCFSWLGMGDDKILGGGPYRWVSTGINSLDMRLVWSFRLP